MAGRRPRVASPSLSILHHSTPLPNNSNSNVPSPSGVAADDEPGLHTPRARPQHQVLIEDPHVFDRRPLVRYSRRVLLHLSRSPLVTLPPNMPEFSVWYGEWTEPHVKKDDHPSSQTSSSNRHRARREQPDEDSRPMFKSQFSQASQMGNFRHHPSRLDDKGDRDSHERLRNLADSYDRSRLLNGAGRRDPGSHSSRNGAGLSVSAASGSSRRGDTDVLAGKERRDLTRGERSEDWRRGADRSSEADADPHSSSDTRRERGGDRSHRLRSRSREAVHGRPERQRERERGDPLRDEDKEWDLVVHGSGRRSPSPVLPTASSRTDRWTQSRSYNRDENRDRDARARTNDLDDPSRRLDRQGIASARDGRKLARDPHREDEKKSDARNIRDRGRDKDKGRGEEKEPAWMGDYVPDPNDSKSGILGGQRADGAVDDLQAWKRGMKKNDLALGSVATGVSETPSSLVAVNVGMDDIQMFKRKLQEEQERQEQATNADDRMPLTNPPMPPPGLTATITGDRKQDQSAVLAALLSPLALQLQQDIEAPSDPPSLSSPSQPLKPNPDDIVSSGLSSSSSLPPSSLSFNRYPDIIPELSSSRDPLVVAGLPSAGRAFDDLGSRSESRVSDPTASSASDTRISHQEQLALNGRLTPTNSSSASSSAPPAQSPAYSGEGSPGSGNALPAYAQSKGSRFAKFWDHKTKDQAAAFNPSQPSQPLAPPSNLPSGSSLGTWSGSNSVSNDPRATQTSAPLRQTPADSNALNSLLRNMAAPVSAIPPNDRRDFMDRPASRTHPDTDRMQSLLSMLNSQQPRPLNNVQEGPPFRHPGAQNGSLNSVLGQGMSASQALPQSQQQLLPFSPVGSPDFDRNFVPDGLVPGLRPPRTRDMDQGYFPTPPPTNSNTLNQFLVNEERMNVNTQQSFDHVTGRPSPGTFPGQGGPAMMHTSGRNATMLNSSLGGTGPGLSNNRHSPGLMQGPQHLQRGLVGSLPAGRGSESLLNMPSNVGSQTLGSLAPNGSLISVGAGLQNPGLPGGGHRGLPSQMGMMNGNAFGNMPNQEPIFQQQQPQVDMQSRLVGNSIHGPLPSGLSASSRAGGTQSMDAASQRMFLQQPSHPPQFQQHQQPPVIRPHSHASLQGQQQHHHQLGASGGLPPHMGSGQSVRPQIPTHGHQIPQPSPHGHLLHPQHPQLQNSGDFNNQQPPFLSQQSLQHTQSSGIGGLQSASGRTQAQAQQDLIALLMGGQSGHTIQ